MAGITPTTALLALLFAPQAIQSLTGLYPPFNSKVAQKGFNLDPNLIPGYGELVGQAQKGILGQGEFLDLMKRAGYDGSIAEGMLKNARAYLSSLDYITAWRRGSLGEGQLDSTLKEQGLTDADITTLKEVTIYYPTPQDLIRFAIRDVYTSSTISEYGLFEDYPDKLDESAAKAGLPPDIAKLYWGAHWELPSPTQVYDMLHRGILTEEQVKTYLKVADYMPYWRDKLVALSYDPLTRVDVRRMYSFGVLTQEEVKDAYKKLGYDETNADRLTRFTVAEANHTQESTPRSTAIAAYKAGTFTAPQATMALEQSGLTSSDANLMILTADAELKQELINLEADAIADQYRAGQITLSDFQTELTRLGVPSRLLQLTTARELAQAKRRARYASKSDYDAWWRRGVIGDVIYKQKLQDLGYDGLTVARYLAELKSDDVVGADKKWPWAKYTRDYSDGTISLSSLQTELADVSDSQDTIDEIVSIAQLSNPST